MRFKLLIAFVDESKTDLVLESAREKGATGATVINHARGEGLEKKQTFFGLSLDIQCDVIFFVVEEHLARDILEIIEKAAGFESESGTGIAIQVNIEDVVGINRQIESLVKKVEDEI